MRSLFVYLTLLIPCSVFSFSLSGQRIAEKLSQPIPLWMLQQIDADLAPFQEKGASCQAIDATIQAVYSVPRGHGAQFVTYEIQNNQMFASSVTQDLNDERIVHFLSFFNEMAKWIHFPDLKILASVWDDFDSPLFLNQCQGAVFAICKKKTNRKVILLPEARNYEYYENMRQAILYAAPELPWEQRFPIAHWRGNTTGGYYHYFEWDRKPRPQLVLFSKAHPDLVDAKFTGTYYLEKNVESIMKSLDFFDTWNYPTGQLHYKYQIAIDGNSFPSSLKWQLLSGSTILKNDSDYIEWFHLALTPYLHYIPFRTDCSDLEEKIHWLRDHEEEAKTIGEKSREFALENLTLEDIAIYYYHLFNRFAKLQQKQNDSSNKMISSG